MLRLISLSPQAEAQAAYCLALPTGTTCIINHRLEPGRGLPKVLKLFACSAVTWQLSPPEASLKYTFMRSSCRSFEPYKS